MTFDSPIAPHASAAPAFEPLVSDPASGLGYCLRRAAGGVPSARVLLLHGVGGNERNLEALARDIDPRVEVLLVRGPLTLGPGQFAWFQVSFAGGEPSINAAQADQSRTRLITLIRSIRASGETNPSSNPTSIVPVVIAGFSQGGIMSASVGLSAPDAVRGFGLLSGRILPEIRPLLAPREALAHVNAFVAHGEYDNKLPVEWAQRADALLTEQGLPLTSRRYPIGHEINGDMASDFIEWLHPVLAISQ